MNLFAWLNPKPFVPISVWLTRAAKFQGIRRQVDAVLVNKMQAVCVVAQFPACLSDLRAVLDVDGQDSDQLGVVLADDLPQTVRRLGGQTVVIAAEMHPLPAVDEQLVRTADESGAASPVRFHVSLDDAVMQTNSSEWVCRTLRQLGMKEDDVIESKLVTRHILKTQRAIAARAQGNSRANSDQEWLRRNYVQ